MGEQEPGAATVEVAVEEAQEGAEMAPGVEAEPVREPEADPLAGPGPAESQAD